MDDLVSKFINQFFLPSKTTNLRNEITNFQQRFDESFSEAWDRFKDILLACPHNGFSELHQLDTFYNALNSKDLDSLNFIAGGNFPDKMPRECLAIIESKSKVRYLRNKPVVAKVSTNTFTSGISPDVAELKDMVKALLLDKKSQSFTPVKAVEESCVTCGDSAIPTRVVEGVLQPVAPTTAEQKLARKNELKAHGTFMPPKPNLVFNTAPTTVETDHPAFNHVETSIPAATPKPASPKPASSGKRRNRKACFVCKSVDHLIKDCDYHVKKMAQATPRNYAHRVLTQSKPVFITAVRPVSAVVPKIKVTRARHAHPIITRSKSPIRRHITRSPSPKTSNLPPRVTAVQALVVSAAQGNPQHALKDKGVIDSGCSRHMIWNMSYLSDFEELNGGYVAFGGNPKGGKIYGKGKIKTSKLDFDDVYFVKELKFNLFSVSQMCDKKNSVLFIDTECLVLSPDFKLPDESQVLLRVPRKNNMYNVNLMNIVP
nr:ribonuclease H-like domain-containing protein [Tanacetum cinerariifolium]